MPKMKNSGLGTRLAVIVATVVISVVAGGVAATFMVGESAILDQVKAELRSAHAAQAILQQQRRQSLELATEALDAQGVYTAILQPEPESTRPRRDREEAEEENAEEAMRQALLARLEEDRARLELDFAFVFDADGRLAALTTASDLEIAEDALTALSSMDDTDGPAKTWYGVEALGGIPSAVVIRRIERDFELVGALGIGLSMGSRALEVQRLTGAETALLMTTPTGPEALTTTLPGGGDALVSQLRLQGQALGRVLDSGQTVEGVEFSLGEEPWMAFLTPLRHEENAPAGALVAMMPYRDRLKGLYLVRGVLLGVGALALFFGIAATTAAGRASMLPLKKLEDAVSRAARGESNVAIPVRSGIFGGVGRGVQTLVDQNRRQEDLRRFLVEASRHLPEAAHQVPPQPPAARQLALVMVEMRRYADPKISYDPEEHMGRYARDLRRITGVVSHRHGRIESLLGHRTLITFEGQNCVWHALCAATEVLLLLSTRENAFDEPSPPVVVLGGGPVASASVNWDGRSGLATAGVPIQQLESLAREATPGSIFLSKGIYDALAQVFQQRGVAVTSQRGLVSPQPLYALSPEMAQQLTGVPAPSESRAVKETTDLDEINTSTVIADRFEVLGRVGSGPLGMVFKAQDRDRSDLVALKVIHPRALAQEEVRERLRDALRRARLLQHPQLLPVLDSGEAFESVYFTRPFVRAMSLRQLLERGRVPLVETFLIAKQICTGLAAAHQQGAVHGHLRPENILLQATGDVQIIDFGISAALRIEVIQEPYNAPESVGQRPAPEPRSDVYALGVICTEMLTGTTPGFGAHADQVREQLRNAGEIPQALENLFAQCFAPPDDRPSAQGLLQDFMEMEAAG